MVIALCILGWMVIGFASMCYIGWRCGRPPTIGECLFGVCVGLILFIVAIIMTIAVFVAETRWGEIFRRPIW